MTDILTAIRAEFFDGFRPEPILPLAEYIERHMWLAQGQSASPGPMELWPPMVELANDMGDPDVEKLTICKGVRCGFTTLLYGAIAHFINQRRTSIIVAVPTDDDISPFVIGLETALAASPTLRDTLPMPHAGRHTLRDTLKFRHGAGWSLRMVPARSPRALRSHGAEIVIADEVSAMDVTPEGHAIPLLEKRSMTFPRRKIIIGSTPGELSSCYVSASYLLGDQRVFEVPCWHCGDRHEIGWADIQWASGKPESAGYVCPSCGGWHDDTEHKPEIVREGRWRALQPHVRDHHSYRINCLVAPHAPAAWPKLAAEFLIAKRAPETLKVFTTTILAQAWNDEEDSGVPPHELMEMAEDISLENIPSECLYLFGGADLQGDRIEFTSIGITEDDDWLILAHELLIGDPRSDEKVWRDLAELLQRRFQHPSGGTLTYDAIGLDVGDGNVMEKAMSFAAGQRGTARIVPLKGAAGMGRPPLTPSASKRTRALMIAGVDALKLRIHDRIVKKTGIRFSAGLSEVYYDQLLSEKLVVKYSRGRPERRFERYAGKLAESLDCLVYCLCAKAAVALNHVRRADELRGRPVAQPFPTVIRSAWLDKGRHY